MSQEAKSPASLFAASRGASWGADRGLFGQTVRTVVILVGACVLFVGALSAAAVAITSKAVQTSSPSAADEPSVHSGPASPASTSPKDNSSVAPKKPLSI